MNPVATLRLAADILRYRPPTGIDPIADDLAAMCDREADHVDALERLRERQEERAHRDPHDGHTFVVPDVDEHLLAIARHIVEEA